MKEKLTLFFAGPLFMQAEWKWNDLIAEELRKLGFAVILPQVGVLPMLKREQPFDPNALFNANVAGIEGADAVLAVFDQADADSGTCWECGYAYRLGRPIIGLRTDIRRLADAGSPSVNLMLSESSREVVEIPFDKLDDAAWVVGAIASAVKRLGLRA